MSQNVMSFEEFKNRVNSGESYEDISANVNNTGNANSSKPSWISTNAQPAQQAGPSVTPPAAQNNVMSFDDFKNRMNSGENYEQILADVRGQRYEETKSDLGFSGWLRRLETLDPYAGYATDDLSATNMYGSTQQIPSGFRTREERKAAEDENLKAYKGLLDAQDQVRQQQYAQQYQQYGESLDRFQDPQQMFNWYEQQIGAAQASGDSEWADSLQRQLAAYRQFYNDDQSAARRMQWVSEWSSSHAGGQADYDEAQRNLQAAIEAYTEGSTPSYRSMTPTEARARVAEERRQYLLDGGLEQSVIDRYKRRYPGRDASVEDVVDWYMASHEVTESIDREVANMDLESAGAAYGKAARASDEEIQRLALEVQKWQAILDYAGTHQNDDVVNAPDFQVTADRGEQEFAEYQQRDIVSEVDQEAYEQARRDAEEEADYLGYTGQDREDHIEAALYVWRQQYTAATANSNPEDPRFHTEGMEPDERWTDEERRIFYYLFATDRERASRYAESVNDRYEYEAYQEERLSRQEHSTRNIGTAFWDTLKSIPGHVLGGLPDYLRMRNEYYYRGGLHGSQYQGWSVWADDVQGSIAQKLNEWSGTVSEDIPIVSALIGGKGAGDLYQIFTSMGESALAITLGKGLGLGMVAPGAQLSAAELAEVAAKGAKIFSSVSFFGSAAASTTRDALQRGIDPGRALTLGFAAGCAEAMFEELSVENLLSTEGIADFFKKGILRTILTQGGVEASEEFMTEIANEFADRWINEGESEYASRIYALMIEGKSYEEAERAARREVLRKLWDASLGGFLSGGMMSAGQFVRFAAPAMYAKADSSTAGQLLDTTAMASPGSRAYKAGERARSRYDSTGKMSGYTATQISTLLDAEDSTAGVQADALREAAAGVRAVTQDGETTEDLAEQIKAASEAAAQNRDATIQNETTEAIDTVKALVEWVRSGSETVPEGLRDMSRQEAEDAIIDLARKLGMREGSETGFNSRTPGAQGESRESLLKRAMDRVSEYTGAAGRIIGRYESSVRETVTGRREERREAGDVFKGAAEAVELEDGSKVTIDKARRQDGKIVFDAKTADGKTVTLTRDQLSETGREVIDFLEDMTEETAADAFNMMMTDQNVYKFAVDFRTMQELGKRVSADRADTLIQQHRGSLTELQARTAFNAGQSMRDKSGPPIRRFSIKGRGRVSFNGGIVDGVRYNGVSEKTMADLEAGGQIDYITKLAKALEIDVVFFESTAEQRATKVDGEEKHALRGAQGIYTDGKIFLDVNAGMDFAEDTGRRMLLLTLSHELTHFIAENAPERYLELRNAVTDWLLKSQEVNFNALVRSKLARSGSRLTYDQAVEEVIADSCETMLADSAAVRELAQQKPKLFDTIKSYIDKFLNRVLARHDEAKALQPHIKEIQAIWDRALKEAVQNRSQPLDFQSTYQQAVADIKNNDGKTVATVDNGIGSGMFSLRTFNDGGRQALEDFLDKQVESNALTPDVPFAGSSDTYHEYVMKHMLRLAAEGDYDWIGWTTAKQQEERWSDEYAEGYRIEYDQAIPKFMRKYVKQWGGEVDTLALGNGQEVWGVFVNDAMKQSILQEGQPMFSERDNARTDRELLMETDAEELTEAERTALDEYRKKVESFEALERDVKTQQAVLDDLVRQHADGDQIEKARTKLTNLQARMQKALNTVTEAERSDKTMLEIIRKEREIQRRRTRMATTEAFTKRELRARITKLYNDLNRRITNPSEKKNIPAPLLMQAIDVLEAINMDSSRPGSKAGQKLRDKLLELRAKYEALRNDSDFRSAAVYDDVVAELLDSMVEKVGDTPINRMSAAQMLSVYQALTALEKTARTALKVRMLGEERNAYDVAMAMQRETSEVKTPSKKLLAQWLNAQLSPERMFNRLGGHAKNSAWNDVYRMLNDGQLKATQIQMEGSMIFGDLVNSKEYAKMVDPKKTVDVGLTDADGNTILITHGMAVALYMHLLNEQNARHIMYGGLTVPKLTDYYNARRGRGLDYASHAVGVSQEYADMREQMRQDNGGFLDNEAEAELREQFEAKGREYIDGLKASIEAVLTDYDRQWISAAQQLFNVFSKEKLNETTMDVYGIKRANVENYMPIWVDKDFLQTPFESVAKDMSLENAGFMKERVMSSKPIQLADLSDVASNQLRRVSQYCGIMPVVRNFGKIWGKVKTGFRGSLQSEVRGKFGQAGIQYIDNLIADLNGARRGNEGPLADVFNAIRGNMARASLTLSLRTALGQTASFPTAASVVGWDALRKAFFRGGKNNWMFSAADREKIAKYSPLLWYRMKGYSTAELGDLANVNSKFQRFWNKAKWATGWIQAMDGATVGRLWYAAEYYVQDHEPSLRKGTDEYYKRVAEVFNDVVERTQPDYTTMQRPDLLRNPNALVKQLTMFLTQRLQNFNILYDSFATLTKYKADVKSGRNGVTQADVQAARKNVGRAVSSQLVAAVTISVFKALADALLHSVKNYRDDDEELTRESVSIELLDMFLDSITGNVLGGSELYDLIEKYAFGKSYYGIEVAGVSTVTDVIESVTKTVDAMMADGATAKTVWDKAGLRLTKNISSLFGIPLSNAEKIVKGILWHAEDIRNGEFLSFEAGTDRTTAQQAHRLYRAYTSANFGTAARIREEVGDDEKLNKALTTYIKQQFADGAITAKTAVSYLQRFVGKSAEDAEELILHYSAEVETGHKYANIADDLTAGLITEQEAAEMWKKYGGMSQEEAQVKASWTLYKGQNEDTQFSSDIYSSWYTKVRSSGVSADVYEDIRYGADADGNGSIKQQEAADALTEAIRSGTVTREQAEAIWKSINKSWKKSYSQYVGT